jgi:hypothetical protein
MDIIYVTPNGEFSIIRRKTLSFYIFNLIYFMVYCIVLTAVAQTKILNPTLALQQTGALTTYLGLP